MLKEAKIKYIGPREAELLEDYKIVLHVLTKSGGHDYISLIIPKGFRFDGATVPPVIDKIIGIDRWGRHLPAALIHDYIYVNEGRIGGRIFTRKFADKLLRQHLKEYKYKPYQYNLAYYYCRVLGYVLWREL